MTCSRIIGNQKGGTPALQLPDDKGRRRGGENPAGGARGGGGVRGVRNFSFYKPGGIFTFNWTLRGAWGGHATFTFTGGG